MRNLAFLLFLLLSPSVFAAGCEFEKGYDTSNGAIALPASIPIPRNAPNGTVLWDSLWQTSSTPHISCSSSGTVSGTLASSIGAPVPGYISNGYSSVFETGIPGIGISVFWCNHESNCDSDPTKLTPLPNLDWKVGPVEYKKLINWRVRLIKTGNVDASAGILNVGGVSTIYYIDLPLARLTLTGGTTVTGLGCEVSADSRNIDVQLPSIAKVDFVDGSPVIQANDKARMFSINLLCDPGVKVSYQVDGTQAATDVLANASGPEMATGVGIRLFRGDLNSFETLHLGSKLLHVETSGAAQGVSIPLTARYNRTVNNSDEMTSGKLSTTATFTLFYE
ncbi:outer membrane usher protein [Metapseudomonas resinovorans]|uniref:fimbrial protein n=1 Tax=Pseudomonadaceae TaxID=135621 RepID=UPI0009856827|nr:MULTISPECIES: fimbrial protein [Pseudomonas]NWL80838.1 type 1 fimbrial protein [Pseudomonas taiwanensis]GLZ86029.1 outer membrane usher protein [Pseudomonas resinovorans]